MARKWVSGNVHGKPENAGAKNLVGHKMANDEGTLKKILPVYKKGQGHSNIYKGQYTPETLKQCIDEFFEYCAEAELKPSKVALALWLGISKETYNEWQKRKDKYGEKTEILNCANYVIETEYLARGEQYPTMNMFLLKSNYGYIDQSKVDITTNGQSVKADEVKDLVDKLGLNKED